MVISSLCLVGAGGEDGKLIIFCKGSRDHFLYKSDIISLYQQSNNTAPIPSVKINAKSRNHNSAIQTNKLTIFWTGSVTSVVCTTLGLTGPDSNNRCLHCIMNKGVVNCTDSSTRRWYRGEYISKGGKMNGLEYDSRKDDRGLPLES